MWNPFSILGSVLLDEDESIDVEKCKWLKKKVPCTPITTLQFQFSGKFKEQLGNHKYALNFKLMVLDICSRYEGVRP